MKKNKKKVCLALHGGSKAIHTRFTPYRSLAAEEVQAARKVVQSGQLSRYLGCWHPDFYGGPHVQSFERKWAKYFKVKHAIAVNSWTSGLVAALGAIGLEPGDEVITCIDPKQVEKNITPYTKAILAVDIAGQSADMERLMPLARKYKLKVICDTAQAPAAKIRGQYAGTLADIGGFSLNYHKHIHTGEGGVAVTNDDDLAEKMRLIRNHAEAVVKEKGTKSLINMIGHNFRLGEIEAAIGIEQLKKLSKLVAGRQQIARQLDLGLGVLPGLQIPKIRDGCTHVYYVYGMQLDTISLKVSRAKIHAALVAEGVPALTCGYQNLHLLPLYQEKIAYGSRGFPWTSDICHREVSYAKGICPVAEDLHDQSFLGLGICSHRFSQRQVGEIIKAFHKVWENMDSLR
ncbi:DegT/DnrJ/EryC1/StrS family aminotransferase [bacterium]|nr:DegT/DnrJ/EryC1/StrS family aminotransferase [bacterium]